jgi:hypothetical protein
MPISCPNNSKIKMVVLTSGKSKNLTWYSILSKDHQPDERICRDMVRRLQNYIIGKPEIEKSINVIYFYHNKTSTKLGDARLK